ncbi:LOW QUALITY PROTEIN: uncharacterized protein LOC117345375 [Pecten maximus]|uniref:LOW QUALITY PROTEIN: uncharacterized protein LOC117345375 n=1 Tax=Pecten maximus TaxID=6579 RepID=UPI0014582A54|nr:LOW QUALITY PROTEIN: uncharacterized protein LOC117345375 [Pecten maximus]
MERNVMLFVVLLGCIAVLNPVNGDVEATVTELFKRIKLMQVQRTVPSIPPVFWGKFRGIYESDVRQYFHGNPDMSALRYEFEVFDNNMFATAWITSCLLEAYRYGKAPKPSEEQINMSIQILMDNHNEKNSNYTNSIMAFWPQEYDEAYQSWVSTPINLLSMFNATDLINWNAVYAEMEKLGLKDVVDIMKRLLATKSGYEHVFHIPPDFDDTSVNLGLGSLLKEGIVDFPQSNALWQSRNSNLSSVFSAIKHYAYRPLSGNKRVDTIDTRTYVYMRRFLELAKSKNEDVALVTTWVQDLDDIKTQYYKGVVTPGNVNNVDITVAANALFGITNSILTGLVTAEVLEDPDMQQIYLNTSTMIAYQINTNFSSRPDLALTYYPSAIEFYWFVARTYTQLLRRYTYNGLPHYTMKTAMDILGSALKNNATTIMLKEAVPMGTDMVYYDDFLGDGDTDAEGKPVKYGEDRLFTTAMAANALITIWTSFEEKSGTLIWNQTTPKQVKDVVTRAVKFLDTYILSGDYKPWNAFFSGSFKGSGTSWSEYPANRHEFFNGTKVPSGHHYYGTVIRGMQGVPNETWYKEEEAAIRSPIDFPGFNNQKNYFPFWSSEPYTYAVTMLALSTFNNIV